VGVYPEFPWLTETENGSAEPYEGPAWVLATKFADALGVEIEPVKVSNDTKVATVQSGQVDIAIAPLTVTAERQEVIDFVEYSKGTICFFGLESNPNLAGIETIDDLRSSTGVRVAYLLGQPFVVWQEKEFPNLVVKGVSGSGEAATPELQSGRTDLVNAICAKSQLLKDVLPGLYSIPSDPTTSQLNPNPIGMGVSQDDPVFKEFLNGVKDANLEEVQKVEKDRVLGLSG
jgi:polar amino acid transport system substrate-binding protein